MKLSDYVVQRLVEEGLEHVFMVIGGACVHLAHSLHHRRADISYVCVQHEQAGAMAVEAYARLSPARLGAMLVTSGPGATNLLTGICGAWFDSIPALFLSGQVNTFESREGRPVRQVGFQETDIVDIARPVTKLAARVDDPAAIRCMLDLALHTARSGRPGPVLLDIPLDVQRAEIDPASLAPFVPDEPAGGRLSPASLGALVDECLRLAAAAERPVVIAGGGVRLAGAEAELKRFVETLGAPVVVSWSGFDLLPFDHPLMGGQFGVYGARGANYAVQNSDLVIAVGSRLDTRQTGGRPETFAPNARKVVVDIDAGEIHKDRGVVVDVPIVADAKQFLSLANQRLAASAPPDRAAWVQQVRTWKQRYPTVPPDDEDLAERVSPYVFARTLSRVLPADAVVIPDCGANLTWTIQGYEVQAGQRVFSSLGNSPMGYSLAAAMGASLARGRAPVVCIIGDGGMQMNIQELQTIKHYGLPLKVFILNNHSYGIIKQFQDMYFDSEYVGSGEGYSCPDFVAVAQAYGLAACRIDQQAGLAARIQAVLEQPGAVVCDVVIPDDARLTPRLEFGRSIEDQTPYLPRAEFEANMAVGSAGARSPVGSAARMG